MQTKSIRAGIAAVIPTLNRSGLGTAIQSVYAQTLAPDVLLIVTDSTVGHAQNLPAQQSRKVQTVFLPNNRSKGLSGALNTALGHLADTLEPTRTFVAFLDDDDWWDPRYLESCIRLAHRRNLDWVVAGITRHESKGDEGTNLTIPRSLNFSSFLSTNPHVQGSNLFVRLSTVLRAGGFDENLRSTTDRDVGIRLLGLGNTRVGYLPKYLVHHAAYGAERLSTPGSSQKLAGLVAFYGKYWPIMSNADRSAFINRAWTVFRCPRDTFVGGKAR